MRGDPAGGGRGVPAHLAIAHAPGHMLITDTREEDYRDPDGPDARLTGSHRDMRFPLAVHSPYSTKPRPAPVAVTYCISPDIAVKF